jgi:hypothetical protein
MSSATIAAAGFAPSLPALPAAPILPLETGDCMNRAEFRRRSDAMPHLERVELIEGIVFMGAAAVRYVQHGGPHQLLIGWLDRYVEDVPGLQGGINSSVGLDDSNEPQPDALLMLPPAMSKAVLTADGYLEGSPEFVAEISASTTSIDSHLKLQAYRRNGIREYLIWRVLDRQIDWFTLEREQYVKLPLDKDGIIRSRVFPGLWLDVEALVSQRRKRVYAVLKQGKASPEFAAFAAEVAKHADPAAGD